MNNVQVEARVELTNCVVIEPVDVGYRSYANDTLIRNAVIGRFCSIGRRCSIGAAKHDVSAFSTHSTAAPADFDGAPKTSIGNDVWIGDNVVIVAGVSIGNGACIGAGSIVTKDVEAYSIVVGAPAKLLRWRFQPGLAASLEASQWWKYGDEAVTMGRQAGSPEALVEALATSQPAQLPPHFKPWIAQ